MAQCTECDTKVLDAVEAKNHCLPLEKRRGPSIDSPEHPSNNGVWERIMKVPMRPSGPYYVAPPKS